MTKIANPTGLPRTTLGHMRRALLVVLSFPLLGGCYRYATTVGTSVGPADVVRVELTPTGAERLQALLAADPWYSAGSLAGGPQGLSILNGTWLQARVSGTTSDELRLILSHPNASDRSIVVRMSDVAQVQRQEVDQLRTWVFVGGVLGASILALDRLHLRGKPAPGPREPDSGDGGPLRVPLGW